MSRKVIPPNTHMKALMNAGMQKHWYGECSGGLKSSGNRVSTGAGGYISCSTGTLRSILTSPSHTLSPLIVACARWHRF